MFLNQLRQQSLIRYLKNIKKIHILNIGQLYVIFNNLNQKIFDPNNNDFFKNISKKRVNRVFQSPKKLDQRTYNQFKELEQYLFSYQFFFLQYQIKDKQNYRMNFFIEIYQNTTSPLCKIQDTLKTIDTVSHPSADCSDLSLTKNRTIKKERNPHSSRNWSQTQNKKYVEFLQKNKELFNLSFKEKKKIKLNVLMSRRVKTRSPIQCHSHHQSMMTKEGSIDNIILKYSSHKQIKHMLKTDDSFGLEFCKTSFAETLSILKQTPSCSFQQTALKISSFEIPYLKVVDHEVLFGSQSYEYNEDWQYQ